MRARPLRVAASPAISGANDNPYTGLLYASLPAEVTVQELRPRDLLSKPDIIHVHWPEFLVRWERTPVAALDVVKVLVLLRIARRRGARLVWTGHDLYPHEMRRPLLLRAYLRGFARQVDLLINLADSAGPLLVARYPGLACTPSLTIRHGHYRGAYPEAPSRELARRQIGVAGPEPVLLLLGQMRRYKNAPALARAVSRRQGVRLVVAGRPHDAENARDIEQAASGNPAITLHLHQLDRNEVAALHGAADVVVLPYQQGTALHSGAALLALSFNRPVVVARTAPNEELRALVGEDWVALHDGSVDDTVDLALQVAAKQRPAVAPLDLLDWSVIGEQTAEAYWQIITTNQSRGR